RPLYGRPPAFAADLELAVERDELDALDGDAGDLDDDRQLRRVPGAEAVDGRAEAVAQTREARDAPEIVEQLLDLLLHPADVTPTRHGRRVHRTDPANRPGTVPPWIGAPGPYSACVGRCSRSGSSSCSRAATGSRSSRRCSRTSSPFPARNRTGCGPFSSRASATAPTASSRSCSGRRERSIRLCRRASPRSQRAPLGLCPVRTQPGFA